MLSKILQTLREILHTLVEIRAVLKELRSGSEKIDDVLLDNCDAKRMLKVADSTLYRWRKHKLIEFQLIGNKYYYRKSDLERLM